ncbi:DUF1428 domain-containing protein [Sphingomonas sp. CLY1604]|uniref:DUF1428 domain-containing protein n=1 Tax=Sphingomonas sp. CLY1604 TaxID=3457786 RepID=UPI003FD7CA5E
MTYVEGFVTPVPTAARDAYIAHAKEAQALLREAGVRHMAEHWGDDVPAGRTTDFARAVQAQDDETIVFSWFEYPDRAARDAANAAMMADDRMTQMAATMPFDGKRMIHGGFTALVEQGSGTGGYVDGLVAAVPRANRDAYRTQASDAAALFLDHGALRVVESWDDDVPDGRVTDFRRAVLAGEDEAVVFSWIAWPDKAARNGGWAALEASGRMTPPASLPFDARRMIYGGFATLPLD